MRKTKKTKKHSEPNNSLEKREGIIQQIRHNRKSMEAILDFSVGIRKLEIPTKHVRGIEDDLRMISTFKNLHVQNHELKQLLRKE